MLDPFFAFVFVFVFLIILEDRQRTAIGDNLAATKQ